MRDPFGLGLGFAAGGMAGGPELELPEVEQEGLVAEWKFDEAAGTTASDSSGNGNDLTVSADNWVAGGYQTSNMAVLSPGNDLGISGDDPRTVCMAVKPGGATDSVGFQWLGDGNAGKRWTLRHSLGTANLRLEIQGAGDTTALETTDGWHFIAVTQSGDDINTAVVYLDDDSEAIDASAEIDTTGNFALNGAFNGAIAQTIGYCVVYDRALSEQEIASNRTALKAIMAARGIALP